MVLCEDAILTKYQLCCMCKYPLVYSVTFVLVALNLKTSFMAAELQSECKCIVILASCNTSKNVPSSFTEL